MPHIVTMPDGSLAIIRVAGPDPEFTKLAKSMFGLSRDSDKTGTFNSTTHSLAAIRRGIPGHFPLSSRECTESDLPGENSLRGVEPTFRDAWKDTGSNVEVDMPKARGIHMDRIRAVRDTELAKKDIAFLRAVEAGDTGAQATIATEKQTLRDIPQTFDLTTRTPDQLKTKWPDQLSQTG